MRIERSVIIHCPVEEVFSLAADPDNDLKWGSLIVSSRRLSSPPMGVGALFEQTASFLGARFSATLEVTSYQPNREMCYGTATPLPLRNCRHFQPTPTGTQLSFSLDAEIEGRFKLMGSLLSRAAQRQVQTDLEALKELLESSTLKGS